jgi:hypothetical protein
MAENEKDKEKEKEGEIAARGAVHGRNARAAQSTNAKSATIT